jgi:A/G-specific adenine glycosylase
VFIHHFFPNREGVHDAELLPLIAQAAEGQDPREWYGALMDYGSYLKQTVGNASRRSAHHVRQKAFKGSMREVRGGIIKILKDGPLTSRAFATRLSFETERIEEALSGLEKEGMIRKVGRLWQIA